MISKIFIVAPLSAIRKRVRLTKFVNHIVNETEVFFFGWERITGESLSFKWNGVVTESTILNGGGYANWISRSMYPLWIIKVFITVLKMPKGSFCWCLGMETAFPALMASRFNRVKIIFDDADRISMIYNYPTIIRICIEKLERWTSRNSTIHIIPGYTRYDWQYDNMYLVRNVALKSDYDKAMTESVLVDRKIFTIYMNGWIARDTGARILLEALDKLVFIGLDIKVIVAGKIVSDDGHNLLRHKSVEYFGEIPQTEALKLYLAADIVVTLYDPAISINKHAESNKWGDCVMLNKPFVVNSEVLTARKFVDIGAAFSFDYENTDQLVNLIYELSINRDILDSAAKKLNKFREDYLPFEEQINRLMDTLYKKEVADDGL